MVAEGLGHVKIQVRSNQVEIDATGVEDYPATLVVPSHPSLQVQVNGVSVCGRVLIKAGDEVEVEVFNVQPLRNATVTVNSEQMEAVLSVEYTPGRNITLLDVPFSSYAEIRVQETQLPYHPFQLPEIEEILAVERISFGIDSAAIESLLAQGTSGSCICASGKPTVEGTPEHYEILVELEEPPHMICIVPVRPIRTVKANTLIAIRMASVSGKPGINVHGDSVQPRPLISRLPKLGQGVSESPEGLVHSTRSGRIIETHRLLDVAETLIVEDTLKALDGHIQFDGDVIVRGNIEDGVEVAAGGQVFVYGYVSNAVVTADAGVIINGSVFQSTVRAGTRLRSFAELRRLLTELITELTPFLEAIRQLEQALIARAQPVEAGRLASTLLQGKFSSLLRWPKYITDWLSVHESSIGGLWGNWLNQLATEFTFNRLQTVREMVYWQDMLRSIHKKLENVPDDHEMDVDIQVKNGQHCNLESTGNIFSVGQGFYQCELRAAREIRAVGSGGVILGCHVQAGTNVTAREIGSQAESATTVMIQSKEGQVKANRIHPGTFLIVGHWHHKVMKEMRDTTWP